MIRLYQFAPAWGLPNPSPFCMKLELFLCLAELPYETETILNPARGPKKKLPYIEDGDTRMGDSALIIDYLQRKHRIDLDAGLDAASRAISRALQVMMDEHLYWSIVYSRWLDDACWPRVRESFFGALPAPARAIVPILARRATRAQLYHHGIGRHRPEEIYALGAADLRAMADYLGDKPFVHGDTPTLIDLGVASYTGSVLRPPFDTPLRAEAERHPNLAGHLQRLMSRCFPEGYPPPAPAGTPGA